MAGSPGETFFPVGRIRQNQEWELLPALGSPFLERTTLTSSPVTLHLSHQAASIPTYVEDGIQCTMRLSIELENFQILKSKGLVFAQF